MLVWFFGCSDYRLGDPDRTASEPVEVTERFEQSAWPSLDVLFVVDSTGSMAEEQAGLAAASGRFLDGLVALGVDYQVGVTTTDPKDGGGLTGRPPRSRSARNRRPPRRASTPRCSPLRSQTISRSASVAPTPRCT
jgi:hypothetical protein